MAINIKNLPTAVDTNKEDYVIIEQTAGTKKVTIDELTKTGTVVHYGENTDVITLQRPEMVEKVNNMENNINTLNSKATELGSKIDTKVSEITSQLDNKTKQIIRIKGNNDFDETPSIQSIINNNPNIDIVFEGIFNLSMPLIIESANILIDCYNATFLCKGDGSVSGFSDNGGGLILKGNNTTLRGGKFYGHKKLQGSLENGYARSIVVCGNNCLIENVYFEDGNGGAIEIRGQYNTVYNCKFLNCNNHPMEGGDYGTIHISNCGFNKIISNDIQGQYYSGICSYGDKCINNIMRDNYIKCDKGTKNTSMGIFSLMGAGSGYIIDGNIIENVTAEGIIFGNTKNKIVEDVKISNNIIKNCDFKCVTCENIDGLGFQNITIENNTLYVNSNSYGIVLDKVIKSSVKDNTIIGSNKTSLSGILLQQTPQYNFVDSNNVSSCINGVDFAGDYSTCKGNIIKDCDIGVKFSYANTSIIENNSIYSCTEGIKTQTDWYSNYTTLKNNTIFDCTKALVNTSQLYGNSKTAIETNLFVKGKLTGGTSTVPYYHVKQGNVFGVYPISNDSSQNNGSIYIDTIDFNNSMIVVKSTNANDVREFIIIKVMD